MLANHPNSHEFGYENASRRCPLGQRTALRALLPDEPHFLTASTASANAPGLPGGSLRSLLYNTPALSTPSSPFSSGGGVAAGERGRRGFDLCAFVAANVKLPRTSPGASPSQAWATGTKRDRGCASSCFETDGWLPRVFALFRKFPFGTAIVAVAHERAVSPLFHPTNEAFIEFPAVIHSLIPSFVRGFMALCGN
jgi:hypothetical protein